MNERDSEREKYYALSYYTLAHRDPRFIHQHIVDAFTAQTARQDSKPISIAFALIGLYLFVEKDYTGMQVQLAHMELAKRKRKWPTFHLPELRGDIRVADVLLRPEGKERDAMIRDWCASVWQAYNDSHTKVRDLFTDSLGHPSPATT